MLITTVLVLVLAVLSTYPAEQLLWLRGGLLLLPVVLKPGALPCPVAGHTPPLLSQNRCCQLLRALLLSLMLARLTKSHTFMHQLQTVSIEHLVWQLFVSFTVTLPVTSGHPPPLLNPQPYYPSTLLSCDNARTLYLTFPATVHRPSSPTTQP